MKAAKSKALAHGDESPLRVLLVEDNDSDAMVAQAAVEKAVRGPREVLRAATLAKGLAILNSASVDLVLLDLNLPDSRGISTLKRMRVATTCPIIVVTVEDKPGLDEDVLGNGAFEILHKGRLGPDAIVRLLRLAEDRHRARGSLEDAEHRFRSLTELSSDWYWEQDEELRFTYYSPGFAQRSGSTPEKNLGKRRWEEPGRAPLKGTWEEHRALLAARKPFRDLEFVRVNKDGTRSFQSVNGEPYYDKAGNFAGYRGTSRDITERKLTEEALEQTRSRLELALAASRVCTWDYDLRSGEVLLSESWAEMIGTRPGETQTTFKALGELVHPEDLASLRRALTDTVKNLRTEYSVEHRVRHQSGEWRWIVSRGKVVKRDARGRAVRMVGTNLDISERKRGEALLSGEKQVLEMIARGAPLEEILTVLMRVLEAQFPGMLCSVLLLEPDGMHLRHGAAPSLPEDYTRAIDGLAIGASVGSCGTAAFRREPVIVEDVAIDPLWADFRELALGHGLRACWSTPIFNAQGRVLGTFAIYYRQPGLPTAQHRWLIDFGTQLAAIAITRRQAESALRQSEARFRSLTELSSDWYWEQDQNFRFVNFSTGADLHDSPDLFIGKTRWELPGAVAPEQFWVEHRATLEAHAAFRNFEFRRLTARGDVIWISASGMPVFDEQGRFTGYRGVGSNITGKKLADEALHEGEDRYRKLIDLSPDAIFVHSDWRIVLVNQAMLRLFRTESAAQLLGREVLELIAPKSREIARARITQMYEQMMSVPPIEVAYLRADGTCFSAEVTAGAFIYAGRPAAQVVARDITERKRAEDDLRRFRLAMDNSADMIVLVDRATMRFVDANSTICRLLGYTREELLAKRPEELLPVSRAELEAAYDRQIADPSVPGGMKSYYRCRDGSRLPFESKRQVLRSGDKVLISVVSRDIRERIQAESALRESEQRFRSLTELSSDWYWEQDEELRFTYLSLGFSERTEGDPAKVLGRRRWEFDNVVPASGTWPEHRAVLEAHQPFRDFEQIRVRDDGTRQFFTSNGEPVFDAAGNFKGYRGVSSNITVRKSAEKRLVYLAQFDPVTGLPNRNLLQEKLEHAIVQSRRRGRGAGALFIDLDRFKLVNDSLGHQAGDALLAQVGRSLRDCVRLDDTVGRLAGDEFAVVIADLARPDDAAFVAQKIVDSFAAPFDLDGQDIYLTASIGIAAFPGDGEDADSLLRCADAAMYRAKESARNSFCFYTTEMNARTAAKLQLNNDLRRAVERHEFRLHYQPKVNLTTGALTGMEALLRWQHPERGLVPPLDFIPALEDTGLIVAVGDWVVEEACRQLRDWARKGLELVPIAVNLSARQFGRRDLDAVIRGIMEAHGLQAGLLELEITESSLMQNPADAIRQLHALRAAGLRISVDDFGTGYSSLAYLTRLPLSTLKIDRSFVNAAIADPNSAAIVRMVIDMAKNLGFDVVAEGIETDQHVAFLRQHGCEQGQGYHFGRPVPADEVAVRLSRRA